MVDIYPLYRRQGLHYDLGVPTAVMVTQALLLTYMTVEPVVSQATTALSEWTPMAKSWITWVSLLLPNHLR